MSTQYGYDTFNRANQTGWGIATDGQTWATQGASPTLAIASNTGTATGLTTAFDMLLGSNVYGDIEVLCSFAISAALDHIGVVFLNQSSSTWYSCQLSGGNALTLQRDNANTTTALATTSVTIAASTQYWIRLRFVGGNQLFGKFWTQGSAEPVSWTVIATDGTPLAFSTGQFGLRVKLNASTDTLTVYNFYAYDYLLEDIVSFTDASGTTGIATATGTLVSSETGTFVSSFVDTLASMETASWALVSTFTDDLAVTESLTTLAVLPDLALSSSDTISASTSSVTMGSVLDTDTFLIRSVPSGSTFGTASDGAIYYASGSGNVYYAVGSNVGTVTTSTVSPSGVGPNLNRVGSTQSALMSLYGEFTVSALSPTNTFGFLLRSGGDVTNGYTAIVSQSAATIQSVSSGLPSTLATVSFTLSATTWYGVRAQAQGNVLSLRIWALGSAEPAAWTVAATDASNTFPSGYYGWYNTTVQKGVTTTVDNLFVVDNPLSDLTQTLTDAITFTVVSNAMYGTDTLAASESETFGIGILQVEQALLSTDTVGVQADLQIAEMISSSETLSLSFSFTSSDASTLIENNIAMVTALAGDMLGENESLALALSYLPLELPLASELVLVQLGIIFSDTLTFIDALTHTPGVAFVDTLSSGESITASLVQQDFLSSPASEGIYVTLVQVASDLLSCTEFSLILVIGVPLETLLASEVATFTEATFFATIALVAGDTSTLGCTQLREDDLSHAESMFTVLAARFFETLAAIDSAQSVTPIVLPADTLTLSDGIPSATGINSATDDSTLQDLLIAADVLLTVDSTALFDGSMTAPTYAPVDGSSLQDAFASAFDTFLLDTNALVDSIFCLLTATPSSDSSALEDESMAALSCVLQDSENSAETIASTIDVAEGMILLLLDATSVTLMQQGGLPSSIEENQVATITFVPQEAPGLLDISTLTLLTMQSDALPLTDDSSTTEIVMEETSFVLVEQAALPLILISVMGMLIEDQGALALSEGHTDTLSLLDTSITQEAFATTEIEGILEEIIITAVEVPEDILSVEEVTLFTILIASSEILSLLDQAMTINGLLDSNQHLLQEEFSLDISLLYILETTSIESILSIEIIAVIDSALSLVDASGATIMAMVIDALSIADSVESMEVLGILCRAITRSGVISLATRSGSHASKTRDGTATLVIT